ncbi:class I SAM-dependent methyltransferase [Peteryoungia algae]|uniref:Class I SAM-dependent methyltransferase n=1 Tax=Peteryoungia algae TaxID=2919917 RepID=A0ABT0CZW2_9HYPH|nr:class I SAM-dependent methyltransferase [Rhizobium sp. SSM4.3]MCJ8238699.1 class I SAM-dependent methyltransferase [Rhizobium sp. SSM4.3]
MSKGKSAELKWGIDALPFMWGAQDTPHNQHGVPDELPFVLSYDPSTGRVIQEKNAQVAECLERVYEKGSILGSNVDDEGFGRRYADDFLRFISHWLERAADGTRESVLEIGCGNGYLLERLRPSFATVIGIEPGPQGQEGAARFGLEIIRDFFPSPLIEGRRFSAIILTSVLEHVEDPVGLASSLKDYLTPGGRIFVSVPDEGPYIASHDVSTLFHEHWSYFDHQTLLSTMALGGLVAERCEGSNYGGSIYAELRPSEDRIEIDRAGIEAAISKAQDYITKSRESCYRLSEECANRRSGGRSLGVYVPSRFVNAMRICQMPSDGIRFFDDDLSLAGTFYPGIPVAVECRQSLIDRPVDTVLIMSRTFGPALKEKLRESLPATTEIVLVSDLID